MALNIAPNAMVTGTMTIVGKDIAFATTPLDANPDPSMTASPYDGFRGSLKEGGTEIAVVTAIEMAIDNAIEPAFVIGSDSAANLLPGRINITGTISAYFQNMDLLRKFVNETESSLEFSLGDGEKETYVFTLPRIKYTGGENPVEGEGAVTLSMPFQALLDPCTGTNIRIDRIAGPAARACEINWAGTVFTESATVPNTVETVIRGQLAGGEKTKTFNGNIGGVVPGAVWTGVPEGLTGQLVKVSDTEVEARLIGTATEPLASGTCNVAISGAAFAFGLCYCPGGTIAGSAQNFTITAV
jgi:hypothetical protein